MNLQGVLKLPEFAGLTNQQALEYGNATAVIGGSNELWSYSGVAVTFGDTAAEGLLQAIQGAGLAGGATVYLTRGIQLSLPSVQERLDAISEAVPAIASVCLALKEIGITHGTRWQGWGVSQPTLQQIAAAREALAVAEWWSQLSEEIIPQRITAGDSIAELKSLISGA